MGAVELVVAVAGENESGSTLDPASEQLQDVERGLVRPVQVLDDQDRRRPRPQLAHERRRDLVRSGAALDQLLELTAGDLSDVEQRPERTRREQRVAGARQDPRRPAVLLAKPSQQRCLPDSGLASHEHQPPLRATEDGGQGLIERRKMTGALEQLAPLVGRAYC